MGCLVPYPSGRRWAFYRFIVLLSFIELSQLTGIKIPNYIRFDSLFILSKDISKICGRYPTIMYACIIHCYIVQPEPHQEARQSPFMFPLCLEAHATPSYGNGDRAPCNIPVYPPVPADTRDDAGRTRPRCRALGIRTHTGRRKNIRKKN